MKDRRERWFNLPFSLGCASQSSLAVATPSHPQNASLASKEGNQVCTSIVKRRKYSIGFSFPKPKISLGIRRLIKSLRNVSQIFAYKEELEEEEAEIEIGYPTDVKHLTHVGWDGSSTISKHPVKGSWDSLIPPPQPELVSFPSISLKEFELAMAAQAQGHSHT